MLDVVLYQPEIPPNTGNIIRLCANSGFRLHLIKPLAFDLDDRKLRRAGLDYHEFQALKVHSSWEEYLREEETTTVYAFSTKGLRDYADAEFKPDDTLLFGPETRGLPQDLRNAIGKENVLRLPMRPGSRSLNLSNSVAVVVYEAWRQLGFPGAGR